MPTYRNNEFFSNQGEYCHPYFDQVFVLHQALGRRTFSRFHVKMIKALFDTTFVAKADLMRNYLQF
jgi:hypothetical protein